MVVPLLVSWTVVPVVFSWLLVVPAAEPLVSSWSCECEAGSGSRPGRTLFPESALVCKLPRRFEDGSGEMGGVLLGVWMS